MKNNELLKSIINKSYGIEYIYSSILIEPTAEQIKLDINKTNKI